MRSILGFAAAMLFVSLSCVAQNVSKTSPTDMQVRVSVPQLIRISGSISTDGQARTTGVTFAIYAAEKDGAPLWQELQNVTLDAADNYNVVLGSGTPEGVPLDLFASGDARWLGVQPQGELEQPFVCWYQCSTR